MDIVIKKSRKHALKYYIWWILGLCLIIFLFILRSVGFSDFQVEKDSLLFSDVKRGKFLVTVGGPGVLKPNKINWISVNLDSAKVDKIHFKQGDYVKKGTIIISLVNPKLENELAEQKWELEALKAEYYAKQIMEESQLLELESQVLNAQQEFDSSNLSQQAKGELLKFNAVSKLDYDKTKLKTSQLHKNWEILKKQYKKGKENHIAQNSARSAKLMKHEKLLQRYHKQVADLKIVAKRDGTILSLPVELGQNVTLGTTLATIAEENSLIARIKIPELKSTNLFVGQKAVIEVNENNIKGLVTRINPKVVNGTVSVDIDFDGRLPENARPELSIHGEIITSDIENALYVERPLFAQSMAIMSLFKLDSHALVKKISVKYGAGSTDRIQILNGLNEGDVVLISDPTKLEKHDQFYIY